jgi:large subunit ribosomal protein L31
MKTNKHPVWYPEAQVSCACGNRFTVGATVQSINTELCNKCHPFYTGEQRIVDTANKVSDFERKSKAAKEKQATIARLKEEKAKRLEKRKVGSVSVSSSLKELLKQYK